MNRTQGCMAACLAGLVALVAAALAVPRAAAQHETPGISKKNHTAYVFAPFKWRFRTRDVDTEVAECLEQRADRRGNVYGQRYTLVEMLETEEPTQANPAKNCTIEKFRDLLMNNKDDMGMLVISTHGGNNSLVIEPFGSDGGAAGRRDNALKILIDKKGFQKDELTADETEGSSIAVTDKFIQRYRKLGQGAVFISACLSQTLTDDFTKAIDGQTDEHRARVALGADRCSDAWAFKDFGMRFFGDLDGRNRTPKAKRTDADRINLRAIGPAMTEENKFRIKGIRGEDLPIRFTLAGEGGTTMTPVVKDVTAPANIKAGDTITFTFDTNCDTALVPQVDSGELTLAAPAWKGGTKHVLEVGVTAPAAAIGTWKVTLKADKAKLKSNKNESSLDGNTDPDPTNASGPANDDYVLEYKNGARVH
ncbi:MAG: hypothetical protein CHACPFDD_01817 [Phycisphaerae bacterium]|nr:hypothetical protein [Phycisphaerae bacterium]